ncbi:MAG: ComF family protein [Bacteroidota bacterium]
MYLDNNTLPKAKKVHVRSAWPYTVLRDFVSLFFPNGCLACDQSLVREEVWLCTYCLDQLPQTAYHQVLNNAVAQKFYGRLPIQQAMSLYIFRKDSAVQKLLYALKYAHQPAIGKALGQRYGALLKASTQLPSTLDLIVPVPLHTTRLRARGYNQSDFFAEGLATSLNIPWSNQCLHRTRATTTQTNKDRTARFQNVAKAFASNAQAVCGKRLLLVDDVVTTGATLEACGTTLLAAGASEISIATIAAAEF